MIISEAWRMECKPWRDFLNNVIGIAFRALSVLGISGWVLPRIAL